MIDYTMPALSENERAKQISLAEEELAHLNRCCVRYSNWEMESGFVEKIERQIINQKIALAALTAKPAGWGLKSLEEERYGNWLMMKPREQSFFDNQPHKYENVQLYPAPPVPVKQEGER